jgi:hypothetical protein
LSRKNQEYFAKYINIKGTQKQKEITKVTNLIKLGQSSDLRDLIKTISD